MNGLFILCTRRSFFPLEILALAVRERVSYQKHIWGCLEGLKAPPFLVCCKLHAKRRFNLLCARIFKHPSPTPLNPSEVESSVQRQVPTARAHVDSVLASLKQPLLRRSVPHT